MKPTNSLKGRVQVINLWRPIRGPLRDAPLAMLDGTTVEPGDLVASDLIYPDRSGETYSVKYNPNHRWFYIPEMTAGRSAAPEVLRFRDRRPHALRAAHRLHRSDHAGRRARRARASNCGRWCSTSSDVVHLSLAAKSSLRAKRSDPFSPWKGKNGLLRRKCSSQ